MDHRERANIGKICTYIILAESFKRKKPLQIAGLILKWMLKERNGGLIHCEECCPLQCDVM
jgi:hypothetical protein